MKLKTDRPIGGVALLVLVLLLAACKQETPEQGIASEEIARPAKIVTAQSGAIHARRIYPGTLESSRKSELAFRVDGKLVEVIARAGMEVRQGDLLARLDERDFQNAVNERKAREELAKIQHNQASQLYKKELASQLQLDQSRVELTVAEAALEVARNNLAYTSLRAPFDGVIARVDVENHQTVRAQAAIMNLHDGDHLQVDFDVPEALITRLKRVEDPSTLQQHCGRVFFHSRSDREFHACYREHETLPDPLTRTYQVVYTLMDIEDFPALPGMSVSIEIDLSPLLPDSDLQAVLVPVEAVFVQGEQAYVWTVDQQQRARQQKVTTGKLQGDYFQVIEGLAVGASVIAAGVSYIHDGMLLTPVVRERGL